MRRLQAFKYELMPDGATQRLMRRFAGARRFVFNKALGLQKDWYAADPTVRFSYVKLANLLPAWKQELPWLADAPSQVLQQSLKDLDRAYVNFFQNRADFPCFKKKGQHDSFRYPQGFKVDEANSRVYLPKLGWIRYRKSRNIAGTPKNITVSQSGGKWYVSIQTEREVERPIPQATSAVGIDVGITRFATLSDGRVVEPLHSFKKHQHRLRKAQQALSRKKKFSRNWVKTKARVTRIYTQIANCRNDFLHKTTTELCKNHALIIVEDLKVKNMSASAKGTVDSPGRNVRQKSGLNRSILDQGWGIFRSQLEYKQDWIGGILLAVPPHNTSITCPCCGHKSKDNRMTQALFLCVECGYMEHADVVGAINIHSRGMQSLRDEGQDTADASIGYEDIPCTARIACEVNAAVMASAAGTHRSDYARGLSCVAQ